jgi:hypothetical protein
MIFAWIWPWIPLFKLQNHWMEWGRETSLPSCIVTDISYTPNGSFQACELMKCFLLRVNSFNHFSWYSHEIIQPAGPTTSISWKILTQIFQYQPIHHDIILYYIISFYIILYYIKLYYILLYNILL